MTLTRKYSSYIVKLFIHSLNDFLEILMAFPLWTTLKWFSFTKLQSEVRPIFSIFAMSEPVQVMFHYSIAQRIKILPKSSSWINQRKMLAQAEWQIIDCFHMIKVKIGGLLCQKLEQRHRILHCQIRTETCTLCQSIGKEGHFIFLPKGQYCQLHEAGESVPQIQTYIAQKPILISQPLFDMSRRSTFSVCNS